jgi:hypothetical protein
MEAIPLKCLFLHRPHGITSQKMAFFMVTAVKTSKHDMYYDLRFPQQ